MNRNFVVIAFVSAALFGLSTPAAKVAVSGAMRPPLRVSRTAPVESTRWSVQADSPMTAPPCPSDSRLDRVPPAAAAGDCHSGDPSPLNRWSLAPPENPIPQAMYVPPSPVGSSFGRNAERQLFLYKGG